MVLTLAIPIRAAYGLQDFITARHLENMAKIMLATGLIVAYGYMMEAFTAWYSGTAFERFTFWNRMFGPTGWAYWVLLLCNLATPQLMWFKRFRTSVGWLFAVAMVVNVGMWLERFVIVVTSLHRDFVPSSWDMYYPTVWDFMTLFGTIHDLGSDFKTRRFLEMLFHGTNVRRADERITVLFGESRRDLDFQADFLNHAIERVGIYALNDADVLGRQATLLAKPEHIDSGAGADGRKKEGERCGGAGHRGLVGLYREIAEMSVHTRPAREVNHHFHFW